MDNLINKFLPVHKMMHPVLRNTYIVVHNGSGSRQGMKGFILRVEEDKIIVRFDRGGRTRLYLGLVQGKLLHIDSSC